MKAIILNILLFSTIISFAQTNPLAAFDNLVGSSWVSEGKQLGGFDGKTVYKIESGLEGKIIKVATYATDPKTKEFGLRNEGIRAYDAGQKTIKFYEFDKLGGTTIGEVIIENKNMHFVYMYQGMELRDSWIYETEDQYRFIVGTWENGDWKQKFHETLLVRE
ncbi:MAG: hypothetical protein AAGA02_00045 [Bacteroidota bacterium]